MHKRKKYGIELKLKLVKDILSGRSTVNSLSNQMKIPRVLISKWIDHYQISGKKGLIPQPYQTYTREFKLEVIKTYYRNKLTLRDCCLRFGIPSQGTLILWLRNYEKLGLDSLLEKRGRPMSMKEKKPSKKTPKPLTRLEELEKENLYLRAENELLKKLEALTQKKKAAQKKKH
jgi:transposase